MVWVAIFFVGIGEVPDGLLRDTRVPGAARLAAAG